jgi:hypothetical protein
MKKSLIILGLCYLSLAAIAAGAHSEGTRDIHSCDVELESDITIREEAIEISTDSDRRMVVTADHALFVNGEEIELTQEERELVEDYARQVRGTIPEVVEVALEGVEIGLTAVTEVFYVFSEDGPPASLLNVIGSIQEEVSSRMYNDGKEVHLKGGEIQGLESAMSELEPAMEDAIADSIGETIMSLGRSLREGEGSLADRITAVTERASNLEKDIETRVAAQAEALGRRAENLCDQVYALQATESQLHMKLPVTRSFDLVKDS